MRRLLGKRPATPLGHALDLLPKGLVFLANQLQVSLDSIAVLLRYSTLQSLLETLQVARLALLPSDAGGGLDELLEGGLELLKLPIGRHLRFLSLAGLCALEDLLVDQHLCPSEALTDGVDASLHLSDIGHNTLDLLLLLRNALDDVHDAIRVQGAVDVLRHGLVLVCEQLGTLFLVLELARHLLHLRLVSFHLVKHLPAAFPPPPPPVLELLNLIHEGRSVFLPLGLEISEALPRQVHKAL
mmetsp:Transcript_13226/g.49055  ORF Transcript_13226/g.49055 Transcript_13226/m.49055 type:complete len:242 (-) Transcript_13226:478-1203(-)